MNLALSEQLASRAKENKPVRIGLIGCGEMGTDIITQISLMPGLEVAILAERRKGTAQKAIEIAGASNISTKIAESVTAAEQAVADGHLAIVEDGTIACSAGQIDVVIEATGNPGAGADYALKAMDYGKHVVMMNVEADITVGPMLAKKAEAAGVVYSLGAGDEPSAIMELMQFAKALGYPVIAAGKGKNNPLNFDATPADYEEQAQARNMNPRMLTEFVDGSKTMIEMTAVANATGFVPDKPGMHGPAVSLEQLAETLCPINNGGLLSRSQVVDYSIGRGIAPGVFIIIKAPHPRIHERLSDLKMGKGPYFSLVRPYHLTSLEVPLTAANAVLNHAAHMTPLPVPAAQCAAIAKCDLEPGTKLGKIGEQHYRGWIIEQSQAHKTQALPIGLAENAIVRSPVRKGDLLTYDTCEPDETMTIVKLRREQDRQH